MRMSLVTPGMVERYLKNIKEDAKDQALRFILGMVNDEDTISNVSKILMCIQDFAVQYPELKNGIVDKFEEREKTR